MNSAWCLRQAASSPAKRRRRGVPDAQNGGAEANEQAKVPATTPSKAVATDAATANEDNKDSEEVDDELPLDPPPVDDEVEPEK